MGGDHTGLHVLLGFALELHVGPAMFPVGGQGSLFSSGSPLGRYRQLPAVLLAPWTTYLWHMLEQL